MVIQKRVTGFVVGSDTKGDKVVHKVRVRDVSSKFDGKKCEVVSICDDITLSKGLDVSFFVATAQERGRSALKAVNVQLCTITESRLEDEQDTEINPETMNICVSSNCGYLSVFFTGIETEEEMRTYLSEGSGGEEKLVAFLKFGVGNIDSQDVEKQAGFDIISALTTLPTTVDVLDSLMKSVFQLGQRS